MENDFLKLGSLAMRVAAVPVKIVCHEPIDFFSFDHHIGSKLEKLP
jgi:hypothetical protein